MNDKTQTHPTLDVSKLESWYETNQRPLPFRETHNPYHIWVSEVMLQQTQVDTVIPYFNRFIQQFPDIHALAAADQETLYKAVEGLGYYRRFHHMHQAAKQMVDAYAGVFPNTYEAIRQLPGIGTYTAGAILSIAFDKPVAATDGNVIRVLSRYFDIESDMRLDKNKRIIQTINQDLIENARPAIYTQALMELGALVCTPKKPLCNHCVLADGCQAYAKNIQDKIPLITRPNKAKPVNYITLIIDVNGAYLMRKRTERLLGGMYEFIQYAVDVDDTPKSRLSIEGMEIHLQDYLGHYRHVFSHQVWNMDVYRATMTGAWPKHWVKVTPDELVAIPMAKAHRIIADDLEKE